MIISLAISAVRVVAVGTATKRVTPMTSERQKSIYIAGPMSGRPQFNFPAFFEAQRFLEGLGWKVFNPAAKDGEAELDPDAVKTGDDKAAIAKGFDFREAYEWDVLKIIHGDGIYMLRGWEASPGAFGEWAVAKAMQSKFPDFQIIYQA